MVKGSPSERILQPVKEQPVQIGAEEQRCWRLNDSKGGKKRQMLTPVVKKNKKLAWGQDVNHSTLHSSALTNIFLIIIIESLNVDFIKIMK